MTSLRWSSWRDKRLGRWCACALALITALWSGAGRTRSIALWSGLGGAIAALGPLVSGWLLESFWWGSVFLMTLPLAAVALVLALLFVPSHVNEATDPVDHAGGLLSIVVVAALVLAIIHEFYGSEATSMEDVLAQLGDSVEVTLDEGRQDEFNAQLAAQEAGAAPIIRFVDLILDKAIAARASDIHFEWRWKCKQGCSRSLIIRGRL